MRLHKIKIENFRSIKHLELTMPRSNFLILVGANNAGKSNVVRAVDAVCGDSWFGKDKLSEHDFYLRDRENEISIALEFDGGCSAKWNSDEGWAAFFDERGQKQFRTKPKEVYPCIYLGADRTFDKHMAFYDWTLVGKIRRAFQLRAQSKADKLRAKFEEVIEVFNEVDGFKAFKEDFADLFNQMQADTSAKLAIDFKPYTPSNYFKTMQV